MVCIVGKVGAGKTALLLGLINEMRKLKGDILFDGPVSYVPQSAWVKSGTVKDNITFSTAPEDVDEDKLKDVISATGLEPDIDMWQDAEMYVWLGPTLACSTDLSGHRLASGVSPYREANANGYVLHEPHTTRARLCFWMIRSVPLTQTLVITSCTTASYRDRLPAVLEFW